MRLAGGDARKQGRAVELEVDEVNAHVGGAVCSKAHNVTVFFFQRGAGDDDAAGCWGGCGGGSEEGCCCVAQGDEPVPAVRIGERDAGAHLSFVGGRMELSLC